jgi:hypothetical protein
VSTQLSGDYLVRLTEVRMELSAEDTRFGVAPSNSGDRVWKYNVSAVSEDTRSQSVASGRVIADDYLTATRRIAAIAGEGYEPGSIARACSTPWPLGAYPGDRPDCSSHFRSASDGGGNSALPGWSISTLMDFGEKCSRINRPTISARYPSPMTASTTTKPSTVSTTARSKCSRRAGRTSWWYTPG